MFRSTTIAIAISLLVLAPPVAVAKEKKGGKKAPKSLHTYLRRHSAGMPLEKDFRGTQYIANGSVNGVDASFLLDTGAQQTVIDGKEYVMAMFTVNIERLIKADDGRPFKKGVEVQFAVLVPQRPDMAEFLKFFAARNPQKVLFFNPSLKDRPIKEYPVLDDAVFTAGVLRTRHLERVMGGESNKG